MKLGLQFPRFDWPGGPPALGATLAGIARTADAAGFASLWLQDHLFQVADAGMGEVDDPMLECYSALSFLAGVTRRVRLGALVTAASYRPPGLLVKTVSTLDVLSGGRAWLGIGAGWYEREAVGLGLPFPPLAERFERLEETLRIAKQMWAGEAAPYRGRHYLLAEPLDRPQPLSRPHPPILIGGGGERKTLRLVARYGDACNLFAFEGEAALARKLAVLRRHCEDVGRDYDGIERTVVAPAATAPGVLDTADLLARCRALAALGFQHVILFDVPRVYELTPLEAIGREVVPAVAEL